MIDDLPAVHPGEILREEYLVPRKLGAIDLAVSLRMPPDEILLVVEEKLSISAELALRLAKYFSTSPQLWMDLQSTYDLKIAYAECIEAIEAISPADDLAGYIAPSA